MNIAHFISTFLPRIGGAEIVAHNLALHQHRAGHDVTIVTGWKDWRNGAHLFPYRVVPLLPRSIAASLKAKKLGLRGWRNAVTTQLTLYHRVLEFDVWHIHMAYAAGYLAAPVLHRKQIPSIITCHGIDIQTLPEVDYGYRLDPKRDAAIREALQATDQVGAISPSIRQELLEANVPSEHIIDIPNGADVERIEALPVDKQAVREKMGWPQDQFVLLAVGRNHPKKGYSQVPDIIRRVSEERTDFLWVIVGRDAEPIAKEAEALGVSDHLSVVSEVGAPDETNSEPGLAFPSNEIIRLYKAADAFAFPTLIEGLSLVMVEALAAGLPLITTDAPGARDAVRHEKTGLASPVGDNGAMAENILRIIEDDELREELGRNARNDAAARYSWDRIAEQYMTVYENLL